jgi:hypothetical protein
MIYHDRKSAGNIRRGNHELYQDRKSTGNIRTVKSTWHIRTGKLQAI